MKFPIIEIVDRYAIAVVKYNNTNGLNKEELDFYSTQMSYSGIPTDHKLVLELIDHHKYVWDLEDDFKKSRIDGFPIEEIANRALHIRDVGFIRAELKNALAEEFDDPVREIKQYS